MTVFGLSDTVFRFSVFIAVLAAMAALETWLPRRERRHTRARRWTTNLGVLASDYLAVSVVFILVPVSAALTAVLAERMSWGLFNIFAAPFWLEAIIALVVLDLAIWFQHWLTHKVPLLWRVHRVHHADHDMDVTTAVRFHPLEIVFSVFFKAVVVLALGPAAVLVIVFETLLNAAALFNHANLALPHWLDRMLRLFVVTPDMHRVHHSDEEYETNSNYGFALSIWDRIFRTYRDQPERGHDGMTVGLSEYQQSGPEKLGFSLALPFRRKRQL